MPENHPGLICPSCGNSRFKTLESRPHESGAIRRRKECLSCKFRLTTYETTVTPNELRLLKKQAKQWGRLVGFAD